MTVDRSQVSRGRQTSVNYSWHRPKENRERWMGTLEGVLLPSLGD